jgi:hypothetical protein
MRQSGFPQIRQGLRRLTRQKMFDVDVGMARSCPPRYFRIKETHQSGSLDTRIRATSSAALNSIILSDAIAELTRHF